MSDYHIVCTSDRNYLLYFFVMASSVIKSLKPRPEDEQDTIVFHLIADDSVEDCKVILYERCFDAINNDSKVKYKFAYHKIDISFFYSGSAVTFGWKNGVNSYYKVMLARVLPPDVKVALYLDIDLYVNADLRYLFDGWTFQDEIACVSSDPFYINAAHSELISFNPVVTRQSRTKALPPLMLDINDALQTGVMLVNIDKWRELNVEGQCLYLVNNYNLTMQAKDALSYVLADNLSYLSWNWNISQGIYWIDRFGGMGVQGIMFGLEDWPVRGKPQNALQLKNICDNPAIFHFTGHYKPWKPVVTRENDPIDLYQEADNFMQKWNAIYTQMITLIKKSDVA